MSLKNHALKGQDSLPKPSYVLPNLQFGCEINGNLPLDLWSLATEGTQEFGSIKEREFVTLSHSDKKLWRKNDAFEQNTRLFSAVGILASLRQ